MLSKFRGRGGVLAGLMAAVALAGLEGVSRATDATVPQYSAVVTEVGNNLYPVILPIMTFVLGLAAVWFVFRVIKGAASRKH